MKINFFHGNTIKRLVTTFLLLPFLVLAQQVPPQAPPQAQPLPVTPSLPIPPGFRTSSGTTGSLSAAPIRAGAPRPVPTLARPIIRTTPANQVTQPVPNLARPIIRTTPVPANSVNTGPGRGTPNVIGTSNVIGTPTIRSTPVPVNRGTFSSPTIVPTTPVRSTTPGTSFTPTIPTTTIPTPTIPTTPIANPRTSPGDISGRSSGSASGGSASSSETRSTSSTGRSLRQMPAVTVGGTMFMNRGGSADAIKLRRELSEIQLKREEDQRTIRTLNARLSELAGSDQKIGGLEADLKRTKKALSTEMRDLEARENQMIARERKVNNALDSVIFERDRLKSNVAKLDERLQNAVASAKQDKLTIDSMAESRNLLEMAIEQEKKKADELRSQYAELEAKAAGVKNLEASMKALTAERDRAEQTAADERKARDDLRNKYAAMEGQIGQIERLTEAREAAEQQLQDERRSAEEARVKLAAMQAKITQIDSLTAARDAAEKHLQDERTAHAALRQTMAESGDKLARLDAVTQAREQLEKDLAAERAQSAKLQTQVNESITKVADYDRMKEQLKELDLEMASIQNRLLGADRRRTMDAELSQNEQRELSNNHAEELRALRNAAAAEKAELQSQLAAAKNDLLQATQDHAPKLAGIERQLATAESQVTSLQARAEKLAEDLAAETTAKNDLLAKNAEQERAARRQADQIAALQAQMKDGAITADNLTMKTEAERKRAQQLLNRIGLLEEDLRKTEATAKTADSLKLSLGALEKQLDDKEQELVGMREALSSESARAASLNGKVVTLESSLASAIQQRELLEKDANHLFNKKKIAELEERVTSLTNEAEAHNQLRNTSDDKYKRQVADLEQAAQLNLTKLKELADALAGESRARAELESQLAKSKDELLLAQSELSSVQGVVAMQDKRLAEREETMRGFREALDDVGDVEALLNGSATAADQMAEDLAASRAAFADAKRQIQSMQTKLSQEATLRAEVEQRLARATAGGTEDMRVLQQQLETANNERSAVKQNLTVMQSRLAESQRLLDAAESKVAALAAADTSSKTAAADNKEIFRLGLELEDSRALAQGLKAKLAAAETKAAAIIPAPAVVKAPQNQAEMSRLNLELEDTRAEARRLQSKLAAAEDEVLRLKNARPPAGTSQVPGSPALPGSLAKPSINNPDPTPETNAETNPGGSTLATGDYFDLTAKGRRLVKQRRYDEALALFDQAIALNRDLNEARVGKASVLVSRGGTGELDDARRLVDQVLVKDGSHPEALGLRSILLWKDGKSDLAETSIRNALRRSRNDPQLHNYAGIIAHSRRDYEGARVAFSRCVELDEDNPEAHFNLAIVNQVLGNLEDAKEHYEAALKLDSPPDARLEKLIYGEGGRTP